MAYPTIRSYNNVIYTAGSSTPYPATIVAGDIIFVVCTNPSSVAIPGYTLLSSSLGSGGNYVKSQYTVADGTESGSLSLGASSTGLFIAAIDTQGTMPEGLTLYQAGVDTPTPPSLTPVAGTQDYLWIITGFQVSSTFKTPGSPAGFTTLSSVNGVIASYNTSNASSITPGTFSDSDFTTSHSYSSTTAFWIGATPTPANALFFGSNF